MCWHFYFWDCVDLFWEVSLLQTFSCHHLYIFSQRQSSDLHTWPYAFYCLFEDFPTWLFILYKKLRRRLARPFPERQSEDARSRRHQRWVHDSKTAICPRVCSWCICGLCIFARLWMKVISSSEFNPQCFWVLLKLFLMLDENTHTHTTFYPSIHPSCCCNSRPQQSGVDNVNNIPLFLASFAEGRREGKLRTWDILNRTLSLSRSSRLLGGPCYPFVTPLWCVNGCSEVDVLANSKIAEQSRTFQVWIQKLRMRFN